MLIVLDSSALKSNLKFLIFSFRPVFSVQETASSVLFGKFYFEQETSAMLQ